MGSRDPVSGTRFADWAVWRSVSGGSSYDAGRSFLVKLRPLFSMQLEVGAVHAVGSPDISRQVGVVTAGRFDGPRLSGEIMSGGTDWQTVLSDGAVLLDCRLLLRTERGDQIVMRYGGVRAGSANVLARLRNGEMVNPDDYYFRINPMFEANAPELAWLNRVVAVGTGHRLPHGPIYDIHEVL